MTSFNPPIDTDAAAQGRILEVCALGAAQIIAWASSTYLPAVIGGAVAADLHISRGTFFAAFSLSLVVMACVGPAVGRVIDHRGGRRVLLLSNLALAGGLLMLAQASGVAGLYAAWCVIGLGMGLGLYDAVFAALVHRHRGSAGRLIVGVTLIGGFASTVGWPFSSFVMAHWGWQRCCLVWVAVHLLIALPLHYQFVRNAEGSREPVPAARDQGKDTSAAALYRTQSVRGLALLGVFSGTTAFVTSAMAVHLPALLLATGSAPGPALLAGALLGPAQVAARLAEYGLTQHLKIHPLATARVATALHPTGCLVLGWFGMFPAMGACFAVLHGAGNGMISVARGILPLALFGPDGYGAVTGKLALFARSMQAFAPFAFALVLETYGANSALLLSGTLSMAALFALLALGVHGQ